MRLEPRIKLLEAHVAALERRELWAGETVSFRTGTSLPVQRLSLLCIRTNRMNVAGRWRANSTHIDAAVPPLLVR